jgi:SNF family Na+-dependent transporter
MSLGVGTLFAYGSYRNKTDELTRFCFGIPLMTMMCGVIGSFVVFSYMGHISYTTNTPIQDIPLSGPELAYVLYPATLSKMPLSNLWAILFFTVMVLLGIDSQFGFMDSIAGTIEDAYLG